MVVARGRERWWHRWSVMAPSALGVFVALVLMTVTGDRLYLAWRVASASPQKMELGIRVAPRGPDAAYYDLFDPARPGAENRIALTHPERRALPARTWITVRCHRGDCYRPGDTLQPSEPWLDAFWFFLETVVLVTSLVFMRRARHRLRAPLPRTAVVRR